MQIFINYVACNPGLWTFLITIAFQIEDKICSSSPNLNDQTIFDFVQYQAFLVKKGFHYNLFDDLEIKVV